MSPSASASTAVQPARTLFVWVSACLLVSLLIGCTKQPAPSDERPQPRFTASSFSALPGWSSTGPGSAARAAWHRSCERLLAFPQDRALRPAGQAGDWWPFCRRLRQARPEAADFKAVIEDLLTPWLVTATGSDQGDGLFTGYFEPLLTGSLTRQSPRQVPIYGKPADLVSVNLGRFRSDLKGRRLAGRVEDGQLVPFATRAAIAAGALTDRTPVLAWADDPIDLFFLEIQGSGQLQLNDGKRLRLGYAAQNGHPYVAIGKTLIDEGALARDEVSLQSIRAWLTANPDERQRVMNTNPSAVFFRVLEGGNGDGPLGAAGLPLTPLASLAVDDAYWSYHLPFWLDAEDPRAPARRMRGLYLAQDTGGAITGVVRGDVFWGAGDAAADAAGRMKSRGRYWLLLPRTVRPQLDNP